MRLEKKIRSALKRVGITSNRFGKAWFRGHRLSTWTLLPRIMRYGHKLEYIYRIENLLYSEFRSNATAYKLGIRSHDTLDYLAAMQHYGVSTRLLDWTEDLDIALYFAISRARNIRPNDKTTWPAIWILNPYRLNKQYTGVDMIFDKQDTIPYDYYEQVTKAIRDKEPWPHSSPIALNIGYSNDRIHAQRGRFTLHGSDPRPLEIQRNDMPNFWHLEKVLIDPHDIGEIKARNNYVCGPDFHLRVYPDIQGYVMMLNSKARV